MRVNFLSYTLAFLGQIIVKVVKHVLKICLNKYRIYKLKYIIMLINNWGSLSKIFKFQELIAKKNNSMGALLMTEKFGLQ